MDWFLLGFAGFWAFDWFLPSFWLGLVGGLDFLKRLCYTVRELERQSLVLQEESPGSIRHGSR